MPPILRGFRVAVPVCVSAAVSFLSLRCRLLDGSHYTRLTNVRQIESTQTTPKPLQTLAFIGVSQPRMTPQNRTTPHHTTAPQSWRHHSHSHDVTTTDMRRPRTQPGRPQTRHGHDHARPRTQRNVPARYHTTRQNTIVQTFQRCTVQQTPPVGEPPHGTKNKAAGSLVLTPNAAGSKF